MRKGLNKTILGVTVGCLVLATAPNIASLRMDEKGSLCLASEITTQDSGAEQSKPLNAQEGAEVRESNQDQTKISIISAIPLNLKQVKISFTKPIDGQKINEAEDLENYTLIDKGNNKIEDIIKSIKVDPSREFEILTFKDKINENEIYRIENQGEYTLCIDKKLCGEVWQQKLSFKDTEAPKVEKVEVIGSKVIKVRFTEPIKPDNLKELLGGDDSIPVLYNDRFEVNQEKVTVGRVELVADNKEANIILEDTLKEGDRVDVRIKSSVQDYAGLAVETQNQSAVVKADCEEPKVIGYRQIKNGEITLIFNKDIQFVDTNESMINENNCKNDLSKFYHTKVDYTAESVRIVGNELKMTFASENEIKDEVTAAYIVPGMIRSYWEISNSLISQNIVRGKDNTTLDLTEVKTEQSSNSKIQIQFSKPVKVGAEKGSAENKGSYTLKEFDGTEIPISSIEEVNHGDREFTLNTSKDLIKGFTYTLTVDNIESKQGDAVLSTTKSFKGGEGVSDLEKGNLNGIIYGAGTSEQRIVIDFSRVMRTGKGTYAIDNLDRYKLVADNSEDLFGGEYEVEVENLYRVECRVLDRGRKLEIKLPYRENTRRSYNLAGKDAKIEISKVEEGNGDQTTETISIRLGNGN